MLNSVRVKLIEAMSAYKDFGTVPSVIVAVVSLNGKSLEIITNTSNIIEKIEYYLNTYDIDMVHKHAEGISIVDMLIY